MTRPARLALLLVAACASSAPAAEPRGADVDAILRAARDAWHAPGIAAAVVRDDRASLHAVGVRRLGADDPVTPDTLFAIGSCTKAFTATALAVLVDEGKADWDDPVRRHLPWFRLDDPLADRDVRLRDLLCHRVGLSRHDLLWYRAPWGVEDSVRRMAHLRRSTSFRSTYEYNNLAYLAAGLAVGRTAKQPWDEFVAARLLRPLKMERVVFSTAAARAAADHASPHGKDDQGEVEVLPWYPDDKQVRASGSMKAGARDMSRWLRFQLAGGTADGKRLVSADALAETHTPQIPVPLTAADREAGTIMSSYGLGWHLRDYRGHDLHEHGGAVDGFRARVLLVPRKKLGVVVLTNLEDMGVVNAVGNSLLDHLLGLEKKDWNAFFLAESRKAEDAEKERLRQRLSGRVRGTKPSLDLSAYAGTYTEPAYGTVTVERDGAALRLRWSSFRLPLTHFHYDTFRTPADDRHLPSSLRAAPAVFALNADGEVSTLQFLGRTFSRDRPPAP